MEAAPDWARGACRDVPVSVMYPERQHHGRCSNDPDVAELQRLGYVDTIEKIVAWEVCGPCPIRLDCLEFALNTSKMEDHGVWGGQSRRQRVMLRRERVRRRRELAASSAA